MSKVLNVFVLVVVIALMIAIVVPAVVSAEEINSPQVVTITEAEFDNWGNHNSGSGSGLDNIVAFSNHSQSYINVAVGNSFYPSELQVLVDMLCMSADWDLFVKGDSLGQLFDIVANPFTCHYVDDGGQWLTPMLNFNYLGDGVAKVDGFELPMAYILWPGPANIVNMVVIPSGAITGNYNLHFFLVPRQIRTRPHMSCLPTDTLWCSEVELTGYQPPAEVQVNGCIMNPQILTPGLSDVALGAGSITTNFNGELRSTRLEIHWTDADDSLYLFNWLNNIKIVFDNGESTVAVDLQNFTLVPLQNYAYFNFTDYFTFLPYQTRIFYILVSTGNQSLTDGVWAVLGNTEEQWCFSQVSFKNLDDNQWVNNILPPYPISWATFYISSVMLRVSCVSNIGIFSVTNGAIDQDFADFAFMSLNGDVTVPFTRLYGFIQGSLNSDSLYVRRDFIDPPGAYVYVNNIADNLRLYDITVDPTMQTNLNSTVESFASGTGAADFSNMNWTIPEGETHILRVVGNISNTAYQYVIEGNKWFKVDILNPGDIEAYDEFGNQVFITDQNGNPWDPGIDGNGNSLPYPVNNTSRIIEINDAGELYVVAEANPAGTNVNAGASMVPGENLKFLSVDEAFNVNKLCIFQADSLIYNRSVESITIVYPDATGQNFSATQSLINGIANFNITAHPLFVPGNSYKVAHVYFNLKAINQNFGAYTGDRVKAGFDADYNFEAKGVGGSNTALYQTSNNVDVLGNQMTIHGNVPIITVDTITNTNLTGGGPIDAYRFAITMPEGGTDGYIGQLPFMISLNDAVPTTVELRLIMFQVLEGNSYSSVMPLAGGMLSGTDAYNVYGPDGGSLYFSGSYLSPNGGSNQLVTVTFYDDRYIPAGTTKYYIVRAIASNVNTGGPGDAISCFMYDGDSQYLAPMGADFFPESTGMIGACLDNTNLLGPEFVAYLIWSDGTGTAGDYNHIQSGFGVNSSSADWCNGYLLDNLNIVRTLTSTMIDGSSPTMEIAPPTEFKATNAPNPFNPETAIRYTLAEPANVSLMIYDILGREVARLVDNQYQYAGYFEYKWNASHLSSGVYFYRLIAGKNIATGKMNYVK